MIKGAKERRPSGPVWRASSHAELPLCAAKGGQSSSLLRHKQASQMRYTMKS